MLWVKELPIEQTRFSKLLILLYYYDFRDFMQRVKIAFYPTVICRRLLIQYGRNHVNNKMIHVRYRAALNGFSLDRMACLQYIEGEGQRVPN